MWQKVKGWLFQNISTRQTVAKNTLWLAVSDIGGRLIRAAIIIYAARILGASEWGVFSYAISIAAFLTIFTDLGISPAFARETAKLKNDPEGRKEILSAAFLTKIALIFIGALTIIAIAPVIWDTNVKALLPLVAFIFAFDSIRGFGFSLIRAIEKMEWEAGLFLLTNVAIVIFGFVFLAHETSVASFTYAYVAGTGIGAAATFYKLREYFGGAFSRFSLGRARQLLSFGWPFAFSSILGALMIDTDILVIGWFRSPAEVGLYSSAQRVIQLLYIIPATLAAALLPTFSRIAGKDDARFKSGLENALWLAYLTAIPLAFGGVILGKEIIELLFGAEYVGGALPFQILLLTLLVNFPAVILAGVVFAYNRQNLLVIYSAIGGVLNAALDIAVIPKYGIVGSAVVTFIAQLISNIYLWQAVKSVIKPAVLPRLKRILPAALLMSAFAFALKALGVPALLNIAASIPVYLITLLALREPILNEIRLIFAAKSRI